MPQRTATHATFTIERVYDAAPKRVFAAFADTKEKEAWFHGPEEWGPNVHEMDFRVGGREINRGGPKPVRRMISRRAIGTSCPTSGSSSPTTCIWAISGSRSR